MTFRSTPLRAVLVGLVALARSLSNGIEAQFPAAFETAPDAAQVRVGM